MGKHYIMQRNGVVRNIPFKSEKNFRKNYVKAVPHRPRWAEKKYGKRVRIYTRKIGVVYYTQYTCNAKGTWINEKRGAWSFTVDAKIYTPSFIDDKREESLASLPEALTEWLLDEFGFRNFTYDTVGINVNSERPRTDAETQGLFIVDLDVEDVTMARGNYRYRRNIKRVNACMLVESQKRESYSIVGFSLVPRVASKVRLCK